MNDALSRRDWWIAAASAGVCLTAAAVAAALYANTLTNPFVYDDFRTVVDNGSIVSLGNLGAIVMHELTRPLTNLSFAVDQALWGPGPWGHHLTNVLFHAVNCTLVFAIVSTMHRRLTPDRYRASMWSSSIAAAAAALLFAVHPALSEAVNYISSRSDLLSTGLVLLSCVSLVRWSDTGSVPAVITALVLWLAAVFAKETAVLLPLMIWIYSRLCRSDAESARRLRLAVSAGVTVMGLATATRLIVFLVWEQATSPGQWLAATAANITNVWDYTSLLLAPTRLSIFHAPVSPTFGRTVGATASVAAAFLLAWAWRRRSGLGVFGLTWFVLFLLPGMWIGALTGDAATAEHRLYLPAIGALMVVAGLCGEALPVVSRFRSTRVLAPLAVLSMVLMFGGRTFLRNLVWSDPVALWEEAERQAPAHWLPPALKAEALHRRGDHARAADSFRRSLSLDDANEGAAIDLVVCLSELGRRDDAEALIAEREHRRPTSMIGNMGRGAMAAIEGRGEEARAAFRAVLDREPSNVMARQWLAVLAEASGDRAEALHRCYELQRLIPGRESVDSCIGRLGTASSNTRP